MSSKAKIRIKVGSLELDYEGNPAFLNEGLEGLLKTMAALLDQVPIATAHDQPLTSLTTAQNSNAMAYSTSTIAAHIDAKTGPELVICAIAQLELIQKKSGVSRKEILAEMKSAKSYFSKSIGSNFSQTLTTLTKNKRIHENSTDTYSLSATEKKSIEAKIAQIG